MRHFPSTAKSTASVIAALLAALWFLPALAQDLIPPMPSEAAPSYTEPQPLAVPFSHNEHNKKAKVAKCITCHHPLPGAKGAAAKKAVERRCSDCHKARPAATDRAPALMVAFHKLCQDCHKAKAKGPVECSGCHKN